MTRGEKVIRFISEYLVIPEGSQVGKPVVLEQFQRDFILAVYDNPAGTDTAILSIGRKNAKALALDTPIPTPQGWKTMADIREGDFVYDTAGRPVKVLAESEVFTDRLCYEVGFSDGSKIVASADHIWTTKHKWTPSSLGTKTRNGHTRGYNSHHKTANVTTEEIFHSLRVPRNDASTEWNHSVGVASAISGATIAAPIDPYLLGYWLGDGTSASAALTVGDKDLPTLVAKLSAKGIPHSVKLSADRAATVKLTDARMNWHEQRQISIQTELGKLNLLSNKHIPAVYFDADAEQRLELLQGLMDSDGTVNRNGGKSPRCSFTSTSEKLASDVWRLVRSLGFKATIRVGKAKLYGKDCGAYYCVDFTAVKSDNVFSYVRKNELLNDSQAARSRSIQITSCEPVGVKPCKCIAVDSQDHLFLAGHGCIPTHNTAIIAFLVITHLVGPEAIQNARMISGALSKEQAAEVFNLASKCVRLSPKIAPLIHIVPASKRMVGKPMNTEYQAISAEAKTAHGKSPVVAILDEVGQIRGPQSDFVDAVTTAQAAYDAPLLFYISTQAATDGDFFSIQIDDARTNKPPKTVCHVYEAPADCDILDEKAWYAANPALGKFRSLPDMRKQAEKASRMPSFENTFRNLNLNQRVSTFSPFISQNLWKQALKPGCVIPPNAVCCAGLDLSKRTDLTAFSLAAWVDGQVITETYFWAPEIGLKEREKLDRVDYTSWAKAGFLKLTPGATVDYDFVIEEILALVGDRVLEKVAFDPWRFDVLEKALERAGISLPLVKFSQGFKNMSPAVEAVEALLLNGTLKHSGCPVQTMCAANATTSKNPTGERMLDKAKSTGRIDGIVAMTMAVGSMNMDAPEEATDLGDWADAFGDPIIL